MSDANDDVTFSVKVMINKERSKVLFVEAGRDFTDVLLSFLALPLGKISKLLENHYGDEAPVFGSLSSLYKSLTDLDDEYFATESAKQMLLNPMTSFSDECCNLKLDLTHSQRAKYFSCGRYSCGYPNRALYQCGTKYCPCGYKMNSETFIHPECSGAFLAINDVSFLISDDLRILPYTTGFFTTLENLSIGDLNGGGLKDVTFGTDEFICLLKLSLISETPLTDLILNKRPRPSSPQKQSKTGLLLNRNEIEEGGSSKSITLKVTVQKSSGKLLFAQSRADFLELLFGFLLIPLAGFESLLDSNTCLKSIDNLYRSLADPIDDIYIMPPATKERLMKPKIPYGYASKDQFLPISEENTPNSNCTFLSPKGDGNYVLGKRTFMVSDDLTVTTFSVTSGLMFLSRLNISLSDVCELEVKVGLEEALGILKASLTSTSALSDGLMIDRHIQQTTQAGTILKLKVSLLGVYERLCQPKLLVRSQNREDSQEKPEGVTTTQATKLT